MHSRVRKSLEHTVQKYYDLLETTYCIYLHVYQIRHTFCIYINIYAPSVCLRVTNNTHSHI